MVLLGPRTGEGFVEDTDTLSCGRRWGMEVWYMDLCWGADTDIVGRWHLLVARRVVVVVAAWEMDTSSPIAEDLAQDHDTPCESKRRGVVGARMEPCVRY